jgi:proteasome assembly chaperone (PAC2) family protein
VRVALYEWVEHVDLDRPTIIVAFDTWVDAGGASMAAVGEVAAGGRTVARFDPDALFDYRARRPPLEIQDGRLTELTWPELSVVHVTIGERDLLVLAGPEPDYRWRELAGSVVDVVTELGVGEWISLGAIPAAVPHTRPVPIMGTESAPGLLRGGAQPGPSGLLRVPAAALSVLEMAVADAGVPSVGFFAQIPHYVSGPYPGAAAQLLETLGRHLGLELPAGDLAEEARQLRLRLDLAAASDDATRQYVERLEGMVDEARLPEGDELISEIERFLREQGSGGSQRSG